MVRPRLLDPHINLSGAFRGAKTGYKRNAFLALLNTKQSDTASTDLVRIPSKGNSWDYRK